MSDVNKPEPAQTLSEVDHFKYGLSLLTTLGTAAVAAHGVILLKLYERSLVTSSRELLPLVFLALLAVLGICGAIMAMLALGFRKPRYGSFKLGMLLTAASLSGVVGAWLLDMLIRLHA